MIEKLFVLVVLASVVVLLVQNRFKASLVFTGAVVVFYVFGFLDIKGWLLNYVNPSLVALMLLLLVAVVLEKSVFIRKLSQGLVSRSYGHSLFKIGLFTSFTSAFLNNTAVVASLISSIKKNRFHLPSKLLLPLSFSAIFGGTLTLIGTSTNLIVNGFVIDRGLEPLGMFDFFYVGIFILFFGLLTLFATSRFLPNIEMRQDNFQEYLIEAKVSKSSSLSGKTIEKAGLRNLEYLFLVEIQRDGSILAPVGPRDVIKDGDILVFSGDVKYVSLLKGFDGLKISDEKISTKNIIEAIITPESNLVDTRVKNSNFRSKFNAAIIAIKRGDKNIKKIGDTVLKSGDKLILSTGSDFAKRDNIAQNFYIISELKEDKLLSRSESYFAFFGFLVAVIAPSFFDISLVKSLLVLLIVFFLAGFLDIAQIKRRFPYEIVLIVGAAFGIATVLIESGISSSISTTISALFGGFGVYGMFVCVYFLTLILTEFVTNNAAVALAFPIGYSSAISLGVDPMPFVFAVAYGASASFLTPYGYQTNLMVASVAGYSVRDFARVGIFVSVIYSACVLILTPLFFPF